MEATQGFNRGVTGSDTFLFRKTPTWREEEMSQIQMGPARQ